MKQESIIKQNSGKDNYKVNIKIDKNIFIEGVSSKAEAIRKASAFFNELLITGMQHRYNILAVKTNDTEETTEIIHDEQLKQIQKTSLSLSNVYNKKELQLLIEDLKFYVGDYK
jgi:hypothetical protein